MDAGSNLDSVDSDSGACLPVTLVHQRAGRRELLTRLQQRLQAREDHRPAAVDLLIGTLAQLIVGDGQPARVADRLHLPGHPRGALAADILTPHRIEALHEPARWVYLEVLPFADHDPGGL